MKPEISKAIGGFVALAGVIGVLAQVLSLSGTLRTLSLSALFFALIAIGAWVFVQGILAKRRAHRALPEVDRLEDVCTGYKTVQTTPVEVDWISHLERNVYTGVDAVPKEVLLEWYKANPSGFSVIKMGNSQKVGHIDILPLRPATLDAFIAGQIVERDIRGDSLYSLKERAAITDLYVESIIVLPPKGLSNAPAILCVLAAFDSLVARMCDPERVENVYAIAASKSGDRLLRRLGFDIIKVGAERRDHHDLFVVRYPELRKNIEVICGLRFPAS